MAGCRIRKGDNVQVIQGKEKGKRGKVLRVLGADGRLVVEKVNFISRHVRPTQKNPQGGVIQREGSVDISAVKLVCPGCGRPTRVGTRFVGESKVRYCKLCDVQINKD